MYLFKLFCIAITVFFITDMIWIGGIAKSWYFHYYQPWLSLKDGQLQPVWWAVAIIYVLFAFSVLVFILPLSQGSWVYALLYGAALGAVIYGVYDFTCLALFKDWPIGMAFVDWAWGTFLCAWGSCITVLASHWIRG